jgi:hypothetical protein
VNFSLQVSEHTQTLMLLLLYAQGLARHEDPRRESRDQPFLSPDKFSRLLVCGKAIPAFN